MIGFRSTEIHCQLQPSDRVKCMQLPSTHWSSITLAAQEAPEGNGTALENFLARYTPALQAHLRFTKKLSPHDIDDILQAFIADKILQDRLLSYAQQGKGRFRSFLLKTLDNFCISVFRKEHSKRRLHNSLSQFSQTNHQTTEDYSSVFDAVWGREVIAQALEQFKQECEIGNRIDIWKVFEDRLLRPALYEEAAVSCKELTQQLSLENESQVSNLLVTGKRAFNRSMQRVISRYAPADEILSEIRDLQRIFDLASFSSWPKSSNRDSDINIDCKTSS